MARPAPPQTSSAERAGEAPPPPVAVPKVAYVMGAGRSGSTILGITLGNCDGVVYAGEMDKWLRRAGDPPLGGDERERFWREVREQVEVDAELTGKIARCLEASSAPFRVRFWGDQRRLRGPYRRFAGELYRAIAQVAQATHVVDTSHFPRRARELQHVEGIELYLLFLVRDPQGIVASWDRDDVVEPRFAPLQTNAYMWLTYLISLVVFLRHPRARRMLVRHEDFLADPQGVVREILDRMGSDAPLPDFSRLRTGVAFQGNRVAREQVVSLNGDAPRARRVSRLTTVLQLPWRAVFSLLGPVAAGSGRRSRTR